MGALLFHRCGVEGRLAEMKMSVPLCVLLVFGVLATPALAKKKKPEEPLATLSFVVVRDQDGKPVRNAAVVMHPVDEKGNQERGGFELKTDPEGKTSYDGVPYGKLRIQVLADGLRTYGQDYDVEQPSMDITIRLAPPTKQYSIYQNPPAGSSDQAPDQKKPQP
jgi:hypothetical protein